jgi:predicted nucleic-acid-binding Zn-ribbon protein
MENKLAKQNLRLQETFENGCERCHGKLIQVEHSKLFLRKKCSNCGAIECYDMRNNNRISNSDFLRSLIIVRRR